MIAEGISVWCECNCIWTHSMYFACIWRLLSWISACMQIATESNHTKTIWSTYKNNELNYLTTETRRTKKNYELIIRSRLQFQFNFKSKLVSNYVIRIRSTWIVNKNGIKHWSRLVFFFCSLLPSLSLQFYRWNKWDFSSSQFFFFNWWSPQPTYSVEIIFE